MSAVLVFRRRVCVCMNICIPYVECVYKQGLGQGFVFVLKAEHTAAPSTRCLPSHHVCACLRKSVWVCSEALVTPRLA